MKISTSIRIDAPAKDIWKVLLDLPNWSWSKYFRFKAGDKAVSGAKGTLLLSSKGDDNWDLSLPAIFEEINEAKYLFRFTAQMGGGFLLFGDHHFKLTPLSETCTQVEHEEVLTGFVGRFVLKRLTVEQEYKDTNEALKRKVLEEEAAL